MSPEVKGYAYCHTFCGQELELLSVEVYGAMLVSKFNNILATCDISIWCTNFQEGYIFWDRNFQKGYIFPEGVQSSWRGTNFLKGYIFGWYKFHLTNFQQAYVFEGTNFTITDQHRTLLRRIPSKMAMTFEVCFYGFPIMQTGTCRSTILCSRIVEAGPYCSCLSVAGRSDNYVN